MMNQVAQAMDDSITDQVGRGALERQGYRQKMRFQTEFILSVSFLYDFLLLSICIFLS